MCAEAAFQFVDEPLAGREFKGVSRAGALAAEYCESNPEVRNHFYIFFLIVKYSVILQHDYLYSIL